jgi:hypothetical protein
MNLATQDAGLFGSGSVGTILLIVGMVVAVAVVSGLGFIARMNDRNAERRAAQARAPRPPAPPAPEDT